MTRHERAFSDEHGTAVLFSAGLDSAVLAAQEARSGPVWPLYVSVGLAWEAAERATAARLLATDAYRAHVKPLSTLTFTMADIYPSSHWAIRGVPPAYDTPDEDVYLIGRNLVLLTKAGTWCAANKVSRIVLGPLAGNPFPDATPEFFESMADALSLGLAQPMRDRDAVSESAQGRRRETRARARSAVRADAVLHEPETCAARRSGGVSALRRLQQVP